MNTVFLRTSFFYVRLRLSWHLILPQISIVNQSYTPPFLRNCEQRNNIDLKNENAEDDWNKVKQLQLDESIRLANVDIPPFIRAYFCLINNTREKKNQQAKNRLVQHNVQEVRKKGNLSNYIIWQQEEQRRKGGAVVVCTIRAAEERKKFLYINKEKERKSAKNTGKTNTTYTPVHACE